MTNFYLDINYNSIIIVATMYIDTSHITVVAKRIRGICCASRIAQRQGLTAHLPMSVIVPAAEIEAMRWRATQGGSGAPGDHPGLNT